MSDENNLSVKILNRFNLGWNYSRLWVGTADPPAPSYTLLSLGYVSYPFDPEEKSVQTILLCRQQRTKRFHVWVLGSMR